MFKKILLILCAFLCLQTFVFADETDVRNFFNSYVEAANSYSTNIPDYYLPNARIIRVVHKPDGTKVKVLFPMSAYTEQMKKSSGLAKLVRYSNRYENVKISPVGEDYKITATRIPMKDKVGLPFHFIVTETNDGYKVKEESMDTKVQDFLKYADK